MKRIAVLFIILISCTSIFILFSKYSEVVQLSVFGKKSENDKPDLFADVGDTCTSPDGMAIDKNGNLFLACTNVFSSEKFGGRILTFDENNKPVNWFDRLPVHHITNKVFPMGIDFGDDDNLYIVDNQYYAGEKNLSRILRVIVENGIPIKTEVLVEGLGHPDGLRIFNNLLVVTDFDYGENRSGIYMFNIIELNDSKVVINEFNREQFEIASYSRGINGIAFDNDGNLYSGHFYTGIIYKFEFNFDNSIKSKEIFYESYALNCADGMFYDEGENSIYISDLRNNAVHKLNIETKELHLIWENDDSDGSDGLLDSPAEPIIFKGDLIISNYDSFNFGKNKSVDECNTVSIIKLK